ncbi:MAG: hypothetical protein Roseis2KO_04670 [Roseivirga sp.]
MPKAAKGSKHVKSQKPDKVKEQVKPQMEDAGEEFDFGGIPSDVSFGRNIGCGG